MLKSNVVYQGKYNIADIYCDVCACNKKQTLISKEMYIYHVHYDIFTLYKWRLCSKCNADKNIKDLLHNLTQSIVKK